MTIYEISFFAGLIVCWLALCYRAALTLRNAEARILGTLWLFAALLIVLGGIGMVVS